MMDKTAYGGWQNCFRLANGVVDLVVTGDVGPRVIRFGFVGGENEFKEYADQIGQTGGETWRIYGGHRLWHSPEDRTRTYVPDNAPVRVEAMSDGLRAIQPVEAATGIAKEIDIRLHSRLAQAHITHRLRNAGAWPIQLAPWALTVMAPGGSAVIPLPPKGSHEQNLGPAGLLGLWAYTDLADPRWTLGRRFILLRQDAGLANPQKIGTAADAGWVAYVRADRLFVKKFQHQPAAAYPDHGCSVEAFTNADMLEIETLGPLTTLQPGESVEHVEEWSLFDGVPTPRNDADVEQHVVPKLR